MIWYKTLFLWTTDWRANLHYTDYKCSYFYILLIHNGDIEPWLFQKINATLILLQFCASGTN